MIRLFIQVVFFCIPVILYSQDDPYLRIIHSEVYSSFEMKDKNAICGDFNKDGKYSFAVCIEANTQEHIVSLDVEEGKFEQNLLGNLIFKDKVYWMEYDSIDNIIYIAEKNKIWKYDPLSQSLEIFRELPIVKIYKFRMFRTDTQQYCFVEGFSSHLVLGSDGAIIYEKWLGTLDDFEIGNVDQDEDLELVVLKDNKLKIFDLLTFKEKWFTHTGSADDCVLADFDQDGISSIYVLKTNGMLRIDGVNQSKVWSKDFPGYMREILYVKDDNNPLLLAMGSDSIFGVNPSTGDVAWQIEANDGYNIRMLYGDIDGDSSSELFYIASTRLFVYDFDQDSSWISNYKHDGASIELIENDNQEKIDYMVCSGKTDYYKPSTLEIHCGNTDTLISSKIVLDNEDFVTNLSSISHEDDLYHVVSEKNGNILVYKNDFSSTYAKYNSSVDTKLDFLDLVKLEENGEPFIVSLQAQKEFVVYSFLNGEFEKVWFAKDSVDNIDSYQIGNFDDDSSLEVAILFDWSIKLYDLETFELQKKIGIEYPWHHRGFEVGDYDNDGSLDFIIGVKSKTDNDHYTEIQVIDIQSEEKKRVKIMDEEVRIYTILLSNLDGKGKPELVLLGNELYIFDQEKDSIVERTLSFIYHPIKFTDIKIDDLDGDKHLDILIGHEFGYWRLGVRDAYEDVKMPIIEKYFPTGNQNKIATDATFTILFSEELDASSLSQIEVTNGNDEVELIEVTLSEDQKSILIKPKQSWTDNSLLKVKLPSSIKDLNGNHLDGNKNGTYDNVADDFSFEVSTGSGVDDINPFFTTIQAKDEVLLHQIYSVVGEISDINDQVYSNINEIKYSIDLADVLEEGKNVLSSDQLFDSATESFQIDLPITDLSAGTHTMYLAGKDDAGNWSEVKELIFNVKDNSSIDWSYISKDLFNTSYVSSSDVLFPMSLKHSFLDYPMKEQRTIVVANRIIGINQSTIWMRDLETGAKLWEKKFDFYHTLGVPCVYNGDIYLQLGKSPNYLVCLDFNEGAIKWKTDLSYETTKPQGIIASEGNVIISEGTNKSFISAYSSSTGKLNWKREINDKQNTSMNPAVYDGKVYCYAGNFKVLDLESGIELYSLSKEEIPIKPNSEMYFSSPVIDTLNNQVILLNHGYMIAIDLDTYEINWTIDTQEYGYFLTSPSISKNSIFIGNTQALVEFNATDGELVWNDSTLSSTHTPVVTDEILVFSADSSTVILDRETKSIKGIIESGGEVSIVGEYLFLNNNDYLNIYEDSKNLNGSIVQNDFIQCYGDSTASIQVEILNGVGELTYNWKDTNQNTAKRENLKTGEYFVTVYDNLKYAQLTYEVTEPEELVLNSSSVNETNGSSNGEATVLPSGGTEPYSYKWSDFPEVSSSTLSNLKAGNYVVEVTDANGCVAVTTIVVSVGTNTFNYENEGIHILPTVNSGAFTVQVPVNWKGSEFVIFNELGKKMRQGTINSQSQYFEETFPSGVYFFRLLKDDRIVDLRFVITR